MTKRQTRLADDLDYGTYLWKTDQGYISDGEGHYLMIESRKGDKFKIGQLRSYVAKEFGIYEGEAKFFAGNRIVSDEEYEIQRERQAQGLTPDVRDLLQAK